MDVVQRLKDAGFDRVMVLDGKACGIQEQTLLLAFMTYEAEETPAQDGAWVHPYYFASQRAYMAAKQLAQEAEREGVPLGLRDEVRVKPIFARIPGMTQGRNTLSYLPEIGSRFHVQIFALDAFMKPNVQLDAEPHAVHCGDCALCYENCPTGAIDVAGFHREKCLRNWQMCGKSVPEELRAAMGNRLIGCDSCQRHCPHNPQPKGASHAAVSVTELLTNTKQACEALKADIGANLALPNRVLAQACLIAGNSGDNTYGPALETLQSHPSPVAAEQAAWATQALATAASEATRPTKPQLPD